MKMMTETAMPAPGRRIGYGEKIMMLGSCFADNVAEIMASLYFKVMSNPFGTLYNPESVAAAVERLESGRHFGMDEVVETGGTRGIFSSFSHHCDMGELSPEAFLGKANARLDEAAAHFREAGTVVVTFGSAYAYRHLERGDVVANCLKRPAAEFRREMLDVDGIARRWMEITGRFPGKQWIFTVSPVRHLRDGLHANQLSKAVLLLAEDRICGGDGTGNCLYFPAYEIVMDELRDYRFYGEDLVHPSKAAAAYVWEKFAGWLLDPQALEMTGQAERIRRAAAHRPFWPEHPDSVEFARASRERERQFIQRINELK